MKETNTQQIQQPHDQQTPDRTQPPRQTPDNQVENTKDPSHRDLATNKPKMQANPAGMKPRDQA
ncbi:arginine--tRNA ligase, partial [Pseudomonas aeruginosa]